MNWRYFCLVVAAVILTRSFAFAGEVEDLRAALRTSILLEVRGVCLDYSHYTPANVDIREVGVEGRVADRRLIRSCADMLLKEYGFTVHDPDGVPATNIRLDLTFTLPSGSSRKLVLQGASGVIYGRLYVSSSRRIVSSEILELLREAPGIATKEIKPPK